MSKRKASISIDNNDNSASDTDIDIGEDNNIQPAQPAQLSNSPTGVFDKAILGILNDRHLEHVKYTLNDVLTMMDESRLVTDEYQRDSRAGWAKHREPYILNWLQSRISGVLVVNERDDVCYIIDGQHRLTALHDFFNSKFRVTINKTRFFFKDLHESTQTKLRRRRVEIELHAGLSPQEEQALFVIINSGANLTKPERLGANVDNSLVCYSKNAAKDPMHSLGNFIQRVLKPHSAGRGFGFQTGLHIVVNIVLAVKAPDQALTIDGTDFDAAIKLCAALNVSDNDLDALIGQHIPKLKGLLVGVHRMSFSEFVPILFTYLRKLDIQNADVRKFFAKGGFGDMCRKSSCNRSKHVGLRMDLLKAEINKERTAMGVEELVVV